MGLRWSEARKAIMSIPGSRLLLFLIHRRMNRCCVLTTQQCMRNNGTYQSCSAVHKQTHIDGIFFYYVVW